MESLLGFKETPTDVVVGDRSYARKLVPWISWDEWNFVRESLFSSSPQSIASALQRISAWRSRGCLPVAVEVTGSIIEIQQKDPFFRVDLGDNGSDSEDMLAMLYCMAIMRLVNGVVEKTRKKAEISIAEAADAIGIPRMLIDIRHEGSHRDLPSLRLVRYASIKALDWLKSYYWEPQMLAIPSPSDAITNRRKDIESRLRELAVCLKIKRAARSNSLEKRIKHCEQLFGRSKFLSRMAGKLQSSKSAGIKKQITKTLKNLVGLYYSNSSEVVSVLLEFLLRASDSSDLAELPKDNQIGPNTDHLHSVFHEWKPVIAKLSNKEPELLLNLLKAVLRMIETRESMKLRTGEERLIPESKAETHDIEKLSNLLEWLVESLKGLKPTRPKSSASETEGSLTELNLSKPILSELLRKCLLVSPHNNKQLMASALAFSHMTNNISLSEKLRKLSKLCVSDPDNSKENSSLASPEMFFAQEENCIREAAEKLEFIKLQRPKSKIVRTKDGDSGTKSRWVVAKSWNPCPIGMLPDDVGSSGRIPILDCDDVQKEVLRSLESEERGESNQHGRKREADSGVEVLDDSSCKKMREREIGNESDGKDDTPLEGVKGQLMIGGVWRKVGEEDLLAIASAVRILV